MRIRPAVLVALASAGAALAACGGGGGPSAPPFVLPPECKVDADCAKLLGKGGLDAACASAACEAGSCVLDKASADGAACDDADACTAGDTCGGGRCEGAPVACDDGNACTTDACDPASGCAHQVTVGAACDDGVACTAGDVCDAAGACAGLPGPFCGCASDGDCNAMTGLDRCSEVPACDPASWTCVAAPREPVSCDDAGDTACKASTCDPATGVCALVPRSDGTACEDPAWPGVDAACESGVCTAQPGPCEDGNPCTKDTPAPGGGCQHAALAGVPCQDGDPCTVGDACVAGACVGTPKTCHDANPCTLDACSADTGACAFVPAPGPCDDGDPCTVGDACADGLCQGQGLACEDGNPCTADTCLEEDGVAVCEHEPQAVACEDGDPFTGPDLCEAGACVPGPTAPCAADADCDAVAAGNLCVGAWVCDVASGACVADPATVVACPASETPCTVAQCNPATGACEPAPKPDGAACDDGDACTVDDACLDGACVGHDLPCDDDDDCTADLCSGGACTWLPLAGGATFLAEGFDGGLPAAWTATAGGPVAWTPDGEGLSATGPGGSYDHGAAFAELRSPELVLYGERVTLRFRFMADLAEPEPSCGGDRLAVLVDAHGLTDQVACLYEGGAAWQMVEVDLSAFRNRRVSLVFRFRSNATANAGAGVRLDDVVVGGEFVCDPLQPCSTGLCGGEGCVASPLACDDGDGCTADACDPALNACVFVPMAACACAVDADCPQDDPCGVQSCGPEGLCVTTPVDGPCDDGSACTEGDACVDGACVGAPVACDDGDPCTADACDPAQGCVATFAPGPCDDGDACTVGDACQPGGGCAGAPKACDAGSACALGWCEAGECKWDLLHDGMPELRQRFDGVPPGALLPAGWDASSDDPALGWEIVAGGAASAPNALGVGFEAVGPTPAATVVVVGPEALVPPDGGTFRLALDAAFPAAACEQGVALTVLLNDAIAARVCDATGGWEALSVDLGPGGLDLAGQLVTPRFELTLAASDGPPPSVRVDDVEILGHYPCDDGDACTSGDKCVIGLCQGQGGGCP